MLLVSQSPGVEVFIVKGSAGEFAAFAIKGRPEMADLSKFRISFISNPRTKEAFQNGLPAGKSVLGGFGTNLLGQLGYQAVEFRYVVTSTGGLSIETNVVPTRTKPPQFFNKVYRRGVGFDSTDTH